MAKAGREIEIKLRVEDVTALRGRLRQLGAISGPRLFEDNTLFDTPASSLRRAGKLLRIRRERVAAAGSRLKHRAPDRAAILTFKAPVSTDRRARRARRYKENEEMELSFRPAGSIERILLALGFRPSFRYQKFRTSYRLPGVGGLHLDLDETPIGNYLELEGSRRSIDRAARRLGFTSRDYITATYGDLHAADCRKRGARLGDLVFSSAKKLR